MDTYVNFCVRLERKLLNIFYRGKVLEYSFFFNCEADMRSATHLTHPAKKSWSCLNERKRITAE